MLALSEFFPGTIADAHVGSLILARSANERSGLIAVQDGEPFFVIMSEEGRFRGFPSGQNASNKGVIVPGVTVEVDETSLTEYDSWDTARGAIVCTDGVAVIRAEMMGPRSRGIVLAMLGSVAASPVEAAFTRWQVTLGTGQEKRMLMKIDAAQQKA